MSSRLHIIPVGISLLNFLEGRRKDCDDGARKRGHPVLRGVLGNRDVWQELRTRPQETVEVPDAVLGADHAKARLALAGLEPKACAEWDALDRYKQQFPEAELDTWVFVGSDTEEGSRAAVLTALGHTYRQENVSLRYVDNPHTSEGFPLQPGGCYVARIPGLDLSSGADLPEKTWLGLGGLGGLAVRCSTQLQAAASTRHYKVVFHLSGGDKAMLPYFLTMAEAVRTKLQKDGNPPVQKDGNPPIEAFCLYEQGSRPVALPVAHFTGSLRERVFNLAEASNGGETDVDDMSVDGLVGLYLDGGSCGLGGAA
ncbi:hypothetical protein MOQ72_40125 [Saccharopolyspora sp. K220]|uniref:hypothetical protein n=1 Tax=Saccharopolyspora soli TaxID=2926618 RepID=UPI001F5954B3|nr:hypothetical protein [Saccharopolyspora soli]MCI2423632.1 hypothetical protein [Saccharopolyspora soli]